MLTLFARHGNFDLMVHCEGDTEVDYHHTTEDIGLARGDEMDRSQQEHHDQECQQQELL